MEKIITKYCVKKIMLVIIIALFLAGCSILNAQTGKTPTITSPSTTPPLSVSTQTLFEKCKPDRVIANLQDKIPYEEFELLYYNFQGDDFLVLWVVDPTIDPEAKGEMVGQNADLAFRHAASYSQIISYYDDCVTARFGFINTIVVDKKYNGWFAGIVSPFDIVVTNHPNDAQIESAMKQFTISYLREPAPLIQTERPVESCSWAEAKPNIARHFPPSKGKLSFIFIIDQSNVHVDAQWESFEEEEIKDETWVLTQIASILNTVREIQCLHPTPTLLNFTAVDSTGNVLLIGYLPDPTREINGELIKDIGIYYYMTESSEGLKHK